MVAAPEQMQTIHLEELDGLLKNMDACARNIEQITEHERKAARNFDAAGLMQLSELRSQSHQALMEMENQCRKLLAQYNVPEDMPLRVFIDLFATHHAHELQALRRTLYTRMMHINEVSEESRIHLKAAFDVTIGVLQHIGAVETKQTYGPGRSA
ncbi:MAG: flagellar export chaperone FlgN [Mariprofundaceae bacterium]|nr:flagellar export chaperone FlgN [Mariprofundaceae bacterium]